MVFAKLALTLFRPSLLLRPSRRCLSTTILPTDQQYPELKRGSYAKVSPEDLNHFRHVLGNDGVLTGQEELEGYNTDWMKIFRGGGEVVLRPKTTEEVSAILHHCNKRGIAICPQGGNTGLVGGSVPVFDEVILSTSLMNNILEMDTTSGVISCESGCILSNLEQYANDRGFTIPIDLGAKGTCQIGGNVSTNAGGVRFLRYGSLHGNVLGLEVVLSSGQVLDCMSTLKKDNTGYDLKQIFIGAEGTLGVVTKVALQCPPKPQSQAVAFLSCSSFDEVLKTFRCAKEMLSEILSSFEVMDKESIQLIDKYFNMKVPTNPNNFYLLLEVAGSNEDHDQAKLNSFLEKTMDSGLVTDGTVASSLSAVQALWSLRENISPALQLHGFVHKHDLSIPSHLFYRVVEDTRARLCDLSSAVVCGFGHLGDSNVHLNVIIQDPEEEEKASNLIYPFLYEWVANVCGSVSAEHGVGLRKKKALYTYKKPSTVAAMKMLKLTFDPVGILNPYKVV